MVFVVMGLKCCVLIVLERSVDNRSVKMGDFIIFKCNCLLIIDYIICK